MAVTGGRGVLAAIVVGCLLAVGPAPSVTADDADAIPLPPLPVQISPTSGPASGGTPFAITGSQFQSGATVVFDGAAASDVVVASAARITGTTPAGEPGAATVTVQNPGGPAVELLAGFTYLAPPAPTVTGVSPVSGPAGGGTSVTITGSGFADGTTVSFGVAPADVTVTSDSALTVTTPPGSVGTVPVTVTVPGAGSVVAPLQFSYTPANPPVVASVAPARGPTSGGTSVTITGTGFTDGADVDIDDTPATDVVVVSSTQITATTPANDVAGPVPVTVTNPDGQSETLFSGFTYEQTTPSPVPASMTPIQASVSGGAAFTITGADFAANARVTFDSVPATDVVVNAQGTAITGTIPAGDPGRATVLVINPGVPDRGTEVPVDFTYLSLAVTITSVNPASGPTAGGTLVTITGTGFEWSTTVTIGGQPAAVVGAITPTTVTVTSPAHPAGAVDVVVRVPGDGSATSTNGFTYVAGPQVTAISPTTGPTTGGTAVTITGAGFAAGTTVTIGGVPATGVEVATDTQLSATTPPGAAGAADVVVTVPGLGSGTLTGGFLYADAPAPPTVTSITPDTGSTAGGTSVVVTGTGFTSGTTATLGGKAMTVAAVTATTITGTTPSGTAGVVDLVVSVPGEDPVTLASAFTYVAPDEPTITSITPASGPMTGGTAVTIVGTGFVSGDIVTIGGVEATGVDVQSTTTMVATTPAADAPGAADLTVTAPSGAKATRTDAFTYLAASAPTITSITPIVGPTIGGTRVTITGTGFLPTTTVAIGGVPATDVTAASTTTLVVTTPVGTVGPADVVVTNAGYPPATLVAGYLYVGPPTFTSITPDSGPADDGTDVTIVGTGFLVGASVVVDGQAATDVVVVSDTEISARVPASVDGSGGAADVVIANTDGQFVTAPNVFTYIAAVTVSAVSPSAGPTSGGTQVTLTGTGFVSGATVAFNDAAASNVAVLSPTTITAVTPAAPAGLASVTVSVAGTAPATLPDSFSYRGALAVTSVSPGGGPQSGGAFVTIGGTGFSEDATVTFGASPAATVVFVGDTALSAVTPPGPAGAVAVSVTVDGVTAVLPNGYTYDSDTPVPTPSDRPDDPVRPADPARPDATDDAKDQDGVAPAAARPQAPLTRVVLPVALRSKGVTRLVRVPITTNAGQRVRVTVQGRPARATAGHSHAPIVRVLRRDGAVSVWLAGTAKTVVTVTLSAPAVGDYAAYRLTRTYRTAAAR